MSETSKNMDIDNDLDDSGCVQDGSPPAKRDAGTREINILDLSDDVLLHILQYCKPLDLKALGFTCPRLGYLIRDRTLWTSVDASTRPTSRLGLQWYLDNVLNESTTTLKLTGYARDSIGCMGLFDRPRPPPRPKDVEQTENTETKRSSEGNTSNNEAEDDQPVSAEGPRINNIPLMYGRHPRHARYVVHANLQRILPRFSVAPSWPPQEDSLPLEYHPPSNGCKGPQFTISHPLLDRLNEQCSLTELELSYCNIDCRASGLYKFPPTLKKLSLRGSRCYNIRVNKTVLFKVDDYLPNLEVLDVSECDWMDGACLLPLSKLSKLYSLTAQNCRKLNEFVAYASLATSYGFNALRVLDFRGSPVGDAEVAAFGWLPELSELYLSRWRRRDPPPAHAHYIDDVLPKHSQVEQWETQEPEYFKTQRTTTPEPENEHMPEATEGTGNEISNANIFTITLNPNGRPIVENGPPSNMAFVPYFPGPHDIPPPPVAHARNNVLFGRDYRLNMMNGIPVRRNALNEQPQNLSMNEPQPNVENAPNAAQPQNSSTNEPQSLTVRGSVKRKNSSCNEVPEKKTCDDACESPSTSKNDNEDLSTSKNDNAGSLISKDNARDDNRNNEYKKQPARFVKFRGNITPIMSLSTLKNDNVSLSTFINDNEGLSTFKNDNEGLSTFKNDNEGPSTSNNDNAVPPTSKNYNEDLSTSKSDNEGQSTSINEIAGPSTSKNDNEGPSTSRNDNEGPSTSNNDNAVPPTSKNYNEGLSTSKSANVVPSTSKNDIAGPSTYKNDNAGPSTSKDNAQDDNSQSTSKNDNAGPSTSKDNARDDNSPSTSKNDNAGPSTSKDNAQDDNSQSTSKNDNAGPSASKDNARDDNRNNDYKRQPARFVKFRRNLPPIVVAGDDIRAASGGSSNNQNNDNTVNENNLNQNNPNNNIIQDGENNQNHVENQNRNNALNQNNQVNENNADNQHQDNVNGENFENLYRLRLLPNDAVDPHQLVFLDVRQNQPIVDVPRHRMPFVHNLPYAPATAPVSSSTYITNTAILGFGFSEDLAGYRRIHHDGHRHRRQRTKPLKSKLKRLVCTGYIGVTNVSIFHLASAAPNLVFVDFSETNVNEEGVACFKAVRPDCEVIYTRFNPDLL